MRSSTEMVVLDENHEVKAVSPQFLLIEQFFRSASNSGENLAKRLTQLLDGIGFSQEGHGCDVYNSEDYADEEPFEVRFYFYKWWDENDEEIYITHQQFIEIPRLAAHGHIAKYPKDETKLRKIFRAKALDLETE